MRKYLIIILILIPSLCFGNDASSIMGKSPTALSTICGKAIADVSSFAGAGVSAAAPACSTTNDEALYTPQGQGGDGSSSVAWLANKFTIASNKTVTLYKIKTCDNGSNTGTSRVVLMNHDSGNNQPDETSEVASSSVSLASTSIPDCGTPGYVDYTLGVVLSLSAGTYWIVQQETESSQHDTNYDLSSTGDRACYSTDSGASWSCTADASYDMAVWGCN